MSEFEFKVTNMDCPSCVAAIAKKIKAINGVSRVDAELKTKKVTVQTSNPNLCQEDVTCVVEDMGYKVQVP